MARYVYMLNSVYPASHIRMHKSEDNKFMYLFIALQPLKSGFEYCRPVVVVDGADLSGAYKGTFISASTLDGAGHILPIAYGVVDSENDNSWTWFFENFRIAFGKRDSICVVSDHHESIIKAVSVVYPNVPRLACIWNLWKNVCTNFRKSKDRLSDIYYAMAKTYHKDEFDFLWNQVGKIDKRVKSYLEDSGFEKWARVYAPVNRGRMMTSDIADCINDKLKLARDLRIIECLEQARKLFGKWNYKNRERALYANTSLGSRFEGILQLNTSKSTRLEFSASSIYVYSVYNEGRKYRVCLDRRTCSYGRFQLDKITCEHAIAVLKSKHVVDMKPYCSEFYYSETLRKTYEESIFPMPDNKD
ncbi:uncharacterized protein LOC124895689 [Capsicum annuum]|uniref:uncharacterized protein LOC124895680 n=1 Tax=Capsicum annuum TaxID=4072 RepID=UPI001FB0AD7A|nr:uncharacterized protein LOC124895680 [Capsicum annuum]XP_047262076.1 uncharacterized protein LOC124895689 [Capsicum annuum]